VTSVVGAFVARAYNEFVAINRSVLSAAPGSWVNDLDVEENLTYLPRRLLRRRRRRRRRDAYPACAHTRMHVFPTRLCPLSPFTHRHTTPTPPTARKPLISQPAGGSRESRRSRSRSVLEICLLACARRPPISLLLSGRRVRHDRRGTTPLSVPKDRAVKAFLVLLSGSNRTVSIGTLEIVERTRHTNGRGVADEDD